MKVFLLIAAVAVAVVPAVLGHGWMVVPSGRQLRECGNPQSSIFLYPAGTGGGGGSYEFSGGYPGLCGDGFMNRERDNQLSSFHTQPCTKEPEVYTQGGEIQIEWMIIADHAGFLQCNICDDADNLSEECFDQHPLMTVEHNDPRWYLFQGEDSEVTAKQTFQLPPDLTCELCTVQCIWWTATHCSYPCEEEICGPMYAAGINNYQHPEGTRNHDVSLTPCGSMRPAPGEKPQMFANCGDIKIEGSGSAAEQPAPMVEAVPENTFLEEADPPVQSPAAPTDGMLTGLSVTDLSDGSSTWLEHMAGDTIALADYPSGFSIRAECADPSLVQQVAFTTEGHSHTELNAPFDMFSSRAGTALPWPSPEAGATVEVTVVATMLDGMIEEIKTSLSFV